jgi:hypothetical protein
VGERWQCPICANSVTLFVQVKHEPRCNRHLRRVVKMVLVGDGRLRLEEADRG